MTVELANYVFDALTSYVADDATNSALVLPLDGNEIGYVSPGDGKVFLITVNEARFVVPGATTEGTP